MRVRWGGVIRSARRGAVQACAACLPHLNSSHRQKLPVVPRGPQPHHRPREQGCVVIFQRWILRRGNVPEARRVNATDRFGQPMELGPHASARAPRHRDDKGRRQHGFAGHQHGRTLQIDPKFGLRDELIPNWTCWKGMLIPFRAHYLPGCFRVNLGLVSRNRTPSVNLVSSLSL